MTTATATPATSQAAIENVNTSRRLIEELWNKGNLAVADEAFTSDYVGHDPATPTELRGPAAVKQSATLYRAAFPDLRLNIEAIIAEGDLVAARWTSSGTHTGDLMGIPPTGRKTASTGITISRFENGRIAEDWVNWDALGLMRQLGVVAG